MGVELDFETADRVTICTMKDQLRYLRKEQEWFEADEEGRTNLETKWGIRMYVHPDDYAQNRDEYIPALEILIRYFGG